MAIRHERERPGEPVRVDTEKLGRTRGVGHRVTGDRARRSSGRGTGWEHLRVAVDDDASRLARTGLLPDGRKGSAAAFPARALARLAARGVGVERVVTGDGPAHEGRALRDALAGAGVEHERARPRTPRANGGAGRSIRTSPREWAYASPHQASAERARALPAWPCDCSGRRPRSAFGGKPPISRLPGDDLGGNDI